MKIKVNGEKKSLDQDKASLKEILNIFEVSQPEMVSVQLNGEFVTKENYDSTEVKDADEVDFLYFMGGGRFPNHESR